MSKRQVSLIVITALIANFSIVRSFAARPIDILYGAPIKKQIGSATILYDGRGGIRVTFAHHSFLLPAKTPAQLSISPNFTYLIHNFGNGSGQIYDLRVYRLRTGSEVNIDQFIDGVMRFSRALKTCKAKRTETSFLVENWISPSSIRIRTEDWTRRPGCNRLNRSWILRL